MKYFRYYPWGLQLLFFMLLVFTFFVTANILLSGVLTKFYGISLLQIEGINDKSPMSLIQIALTIQGASSLLVFFLPGFLFAYLSHPQPLQYLGLVKPGKNIQFLLVLLLMLGAIPVLQIFEGLISKINFGEDVRKSQAANDEMMSAFMRMPDFLTFCKAFLVMAIVPAVGEELFFRGVMMRFAKHNTRKMTFPIVFSAMVFALAHSNIYGYFSIFLAGALLGTIYYLTSSLWCSILAHLFFNGSQIVLAYLANRDGTIKNVMDSGSILAYIPYAIGGAILFSVSFYFLLKNKTPLADNWPQNFSEEEQLQMMKQE